MCARQARYAFASDAGGQAPRCTAHALLFRRVRDRALRVAAVVGTALFAINQLDVVLRDGISAIVIAKIALTYSVPYAVSTYSALAVSRIRPGSAVS